MEPTGVMDSRELHTQTGAGHFTVCDLADEEVHFSRNPSDYYYCRAEPGTSHAAHHQHAGSSPRKPSLTQDLDQLASLDHPVNGYCDPNEQVASNRLLSNLSGKLRRGSNYLNAPAKLVGQYLLGITIQSWPEFFNTSRMTRAPCTRHQLARRFSRNLNHFQGNYLCVSLILVIYCILTSPLLLVAIAAYLMALYLVTARSALGKQTRVFGYRLNLQQQYSFITMLSLPPLWIAGAPSAVFWVIGASFFVVGLHASIYANEQELDHQMVLSSARATHSLTQAHAPPIQIAPRRSPSLDGYAQIGRRQASPAAAQLSYYNHHPVAKSAIGGPTAPSSGFVSNTLSQWIMFGGRTPAGNGAVHTAASAHRSPDVKIISRDYAGLGRVYEV